MSQAGIINTAGGPSPPDVPTTFVTDVNSPAIPALNILDVFGADTTANNDNGIRTDGSSGSNVLTVQLTNRATGQIITPADALTTILTIPMGATPGTFMVFGNVQAFAASVPAGASYGFSGAFRTTGAAAVEIASEYHDEFEEAAFVNADIFLAVSANNILVQVLGINSVSVNWNSLLEYRMVT